MTRRRCCCTRGCIIFTDDFDRPNNTNVGGKWVETVGDSEIFDEKLRQPPLARVISTERHPALSVTGLVFVTLVDIVDGALHHIILNYVDPDNYIYVSFSTYPVGDPPVQYCGLGIYHVAGGVTTLLHAISVEGELPDDEVDIEVCRNNTGVYAWITDPFYLHSWACVPDEGELGYYVGLENGSTEGQLVHWDDYMWEEHKITNPICPVCLCDCGGYCVSRWLKLTIVASGICSCWNGATADFDYQEDNPDYYSWYAGPIVHWGWDACDQPPGDPDLEFRLFCDQGGEEGWEDWELCLHRIGDSGICGGSGQCERGDSIWNTKSPSSGSCSPFTLTFGPFTCATEGGTCVWWVVVTEREIEI